MKAIIMAGGEGSRLRPLTCDLPKPMAPLMDRPVMAYAVELLKRHGVTEIGSTLMYLPERIQSYFGDGSAFGVSMRYFIEKTPLGTAGSMHLARDFLTETFAVLSGDGVTDCDLTEALRFHREKGALATLVLKRVENPLEYGVVIADASGRVTRFVEKPGWGEVFSDTVNTGIYILEPEALRLIPEGRAFDFGHDLFPQMAERGEAVYAWTMEGYWCDIGDTAAYLKAHTDAMDGRVDLPLTARPGGVARMPGSHVDQGAVVEGPCFIGEGATVKAGARVGAYSVVGAGCVVETGASLKRAVLWRGARVGEGAQARCCVLMDGARMEPDSAAFEESVLGSGATLGAGASLMPGVKVWPRKKIGAGARLDANVVWGDTDRASFSRGCLRLDSPESAARAGAAAASAMGVKTALIGRAAGAAAQAGAMALEAGLMAQGAQALDGGCAALIQLRHQLWQTGADAAFWLSGECVRVLDGDGVEPGVAVQRRIEQLLLRQDYARAFATPPCPPLNAGRGDLSYIGMLSRDPDIDLGGGRRPQVALFAADEPLLSLAERALEKAGCLVRAEWEEEMMDLAPGETGVWLEADGEELYLADERGCLTEDEMRLMRVWTALELGLRRLPVPMNATHAAEALAARYGAEIVRVSAERPALMRELIEADRRLFRLWFDGPYAALLCLTCLRRQSLSPSDWAARMPRLARSARSVPLSEKDRSRVLRGLIDQEDAPDMTDGLSVRRGEGWALVKPASDRPECRIVAEAADMETADELCAFYEKRVKALLGKDDGRRT
ncbi:MAG: hypothetical protein IKO07_00185 [Clostridia bacterium]|nr:hypothetical protein [Clostridia bacterium]